MCQTQPQVTTHPWFEHRHVMELRASPSILPQFQDGDHNVDECPPWACTLVGHSVEKQLALALALQCCGGILSNAEVEVARRKSGLWSPLLICVCPSSFCATCIRIPRQGLDKRVFCDSTQIMLEIKGIALHWFLFADCGPRTLWLLWPVSPKPQHDRSTVQTTFF